MYGGAYSVTVQTINATNPNYTLSRASSNALVLGAYSSQHEGLYQLHEMQAPALPKGVVKPSSNIQSLVALVEPAKNDESAFVSYIGAIQVGKESVQPFACSDSIHSLGLSEWFTWSGEPIKVDFYAEKGNPMRFKLALIDSTGAVLQSWKPKAKGNGPLFELDQALVDNKFQNLVLNNSGVSSIYDKVKLVALPETDDSSIYVLGTSIEVGWETGNTIAEIEELQSLESLIDYNLIQAYPNPFNPTTTIRFKLETKSQLTIRVFDSVGRLVSELFKGEKRVFMSLASMPANGLVERILSECNINKRTARFN